MTKISLLFAIFLSFCFYHNSSSQESEKCECDTLQLSKSGEITNFTKQSGEINGRPFYFSITDHKESEIRYQEDIVWWNQTASSWMFQNHVPSSKLWATWLEVKKNLNCPKFSTTKGWLDHSQGKNGSIQSRCLTDINKCLGKFNAKSVSMYY